MKLVLNENDLQRLTVMIGEVPHKQAVPIVQLLNEVMQRQQTQNGAMSLDTKATGGAEQPAH